MQQIKSERKRIKAYFFKVFNGQGTSPELEEIKKCPIPSRFGGLGCHLKIPPKFVRSHPAKTRSEKRFSEMMPLSFYQSLAEGLERACHAWEEFCRESGGEV